MMPCANAVGTRRLATRGPAVEAGRASSGAVLSGMGATVSTERTRAAGAGTGRAWPRALATARPWPRWPAGHRQRAEPARAGASRSWRRALVACLLCFGALCFGALVDTAAAQEPEITTFFTNTGASGSKIRTATNLALGVRTGRNRGGYTLTEVRLHAISADIANTSLSIRKDRADGTEIATLQYSATLAAYTASPNTVMDPDTTYYFKFNPGPGPARVPIVPLWSRDTSGNEWNLFEGYRFKTSENRWLPSTYGGVSHVMPMAFMGYNNEAGPNRPPTSANGRVASEQGRDYVFGRSDFRYSDPDVLDPFSGIEITSLPDSGDGTLKVDGTALAAQDLPKTVTRSELDRGKLVYTPPTGEPEDAIASFGFKVSDGMATSALAYTMSISLVLPRAVLLSIEPTSTPPRRRSGTESGSGTPDTYGNGDILEITATFDSGVTVRGNPEFMFRYRGDRFVGENYYFVDAQYDRVRSAAAGRNKVVFTYRVIDTSEFTPGHTGIQITRKAPCCVAHNPFYFYDSAQWSSSGHSWIPSSAIDSANGGGSARLEIAKDVVYLGHKLDAGLGSRLRENRAPTAAVGRITAAQGAEYAFSVSDFGYHDDDDDPLSAVSIVSPPTAGELLFDGSTLAAGAWVTRTELDAGDLTYRAPENTTGADVASFTFKVSDGRRESVAEYVMNIDVQASGGQVEVEPPTIDATPRVSGAGDDGTWEAGETVRVALAFSEAVEVDTSGGTPSVGIELGGTAARSATYQSGSGTVELVFDYTLVGGDGSHSFMAVTPDSLALNGGTIRSTETETDAQLAHNGAVVQGDSARDDGPEASFRNVPKSHDGETAFTVGLQFRGEPSGLSAKRDAASVLELTGGSVAGAREVAGSANPAWEVTVAPDGPDDVTIRLPARACTEPNAVCIGGAPLSEAVEATVPGTPPTVSISAVVTPVTEGAAAAFALTRTGDTAQALTVAVAVSETGSVLDGEPPASATFEAGSDSATLSVATVDDEAVEPASTVTAALSAGEGYAVDAASGSAGVAVGDDDAAPVVETASPIEVAENATVVAVLSASDADTAAQDLSWSIPEGAPGGADGAEFALTSGGALSFKVAKDFEAPDDADIDGDYGVTVRVTDGSNPVDVALVVRLVDIEEVRPTARFERLAERHDGETAFTVVLRFSGAPEGLTQATVENALLEVTGGTVTEARPTVEGATTAWEVTVAPAGPGDVTLRLPVRACGEANAVCIGGAPLSEAVEATVPGTPMTARFTQASQAHDGTSSFELRMDFSHEPVGYSYRTVRDALFDVEGARIERVWRRVRGKNQLWGLKVVPRTSGDVILTARATTDCSARHAACDADGRKFDGALSLTIAGPQSTVGPVVSIAAPAQTPMTEGTALEFALARTGDVAEPLTVPVSVTESAGMLGGTAPVSVTFESGSASAALSILTEDDERVEGASTVTVTLAPGEGYSLDGSAASADGVVDDDDAAPVVRTPSPILAAENATAVATLLATDADTAAEVLAWSISEGATGDADGAQFTLSAQGALAFRAAKDFEAPDDANADGEYEVTVRITDGSNPVDVPLVVRLSDVDDTAPALSGASVDGAALTLTFSETLDGDSAPPASSFAVTAAGSARTVDAVVAAGKAVVLTLSRAVTSGKTVTVGYSVPTVAGAKPIRDAAGNPAAAFASTEVTNATAALPVVSVAASTSPVTEGAAPRFALTRTGDTAAALTVSVSVSETEVAVSGTPPASVTFAAGSDSATLSVPTEDDEVSEAASTVTATLLAGAGYTVDEASGSAEVVVEDDDAAPVVETASPIVVAENETAIATLTATDADTAAEALVWSIPEGEAGGADGGHFTLSAQGALAFRVAKDFEAPDDADGDYEVTVRVSDGTNAIDAALVVRLADADDAAPSLSRASVDGGVLTLAFDKALAEESVPPASSFAVIAGGSERTVDGVEISGETVVVTFSPSAWAGETVTVGYTVPTGPGTAPLRDAAGNRVASFASAETENRTTLPVVSIRAASTPVTEGTAATFVLTRTGATAAALTVAVSVTEAGSVVDGATASSATFAPGASEARLSVATVNDGVHEADARLSASIQGADGYEVEEGARSAVVDVFDDDDAAAPPATEVWSSTLAWTDLGNNWFGGFAEAFSDPEWSEGGQDFRIWYIAYDAGARELSMAHRGVDGVIGEPGQLALNVGGLTLGAGNALSAFARAGVARAGGIDSQWRAGEQVRVRLTRTVGEAEPVAAGPGLSVADAEVNESAGVPLRFRVTLDAPAQSAVSVRYRTADGSARAGADYAPAHGAVRFAPGETVKTVEVAVVKDSYDEGSETMTLTLYRPSGAGIGDSVATGTIVNTGPIPKAWIARFGRTVAEQAVEAVEARFEAPRAPGFAGSIAGHGVSGFGERADGGVQDAREGLEALGGWVSGKSGEKADAEAFESRTLTGREVLAGSTFALTGGTAESGLASFWGRGAVTRFDGRDGALSVDGEVASAMLGADWTRDRVLAGLMLSHSRGEGGYRDGSGTGEVESTLTALFPYARYALSERVSVWGMAGVGEGTLTLTPEGQAPMRPDMDLLMGAVGLRGVLVEGGTEGPTLAAMSDAFAVRTSIDAVSGSAGNLKAAQADVTRVRLGLEGSQPVRLGGDAVLTPSLELGVRHDGGDAETGFGADIGAGLALAAPSRGLTAEVRARGLLTHEADGLRERGVSGTLAFDPAPDSDRGLSLSLSQTVGAHGEGGVDALLERSTLAGLGGDDGPGAPQRRFEARLGYGLGVFDDRWTATLELGLGLSDTGRELRLGWRLTERVAAGLARHAVFEMRIEAARVDAANDDAPSEERIGLELTARW